MRYIDADIIREKIEALYEHHLEMMNFSADNACLECLELLDDTPTADVSPKSEVEKLSHKCDECAGCTQWKCDCANIELEVAREIFEEIEKCAYTHFDVRGDEESLEILIDEFAELKKKYTGEQT